VTGIQELGETTQLVTISEDLSMGIWEATTGSLLARVHFACKPTKLSVSRNGKVAFVGSEKGILRIYDLSNRAMPRLIKIFNFFDQIPISCICSSQDGKFVTISSVESD